MILDHFSKGRIDAALCGEAKIKSQGVIELFWRQIVNQSFKYTLAILAFIWLSKATAAPANVLINREFSLGIGQTASVEGEKLFIKFKAVLEDSRCPINVVCVWAGNGKV